MSGAGTRSGPVRVGGASPTPPEHLFGRATPTPQAAVGPAGSPTVGPWPLATGWTSSGRSPARRCADLFDQRKPFGRLALVQVLMLAGDTLVTISLAESLFFSISPHEAKSKVLLYLLLTLAPFAVVSPLLGPLIDRSKGARRATAVAAGGRPGGPLPVHGHGHPQPAAVPRGLPRPRLLQAVPGDPGRARPRDDVADAAAPAAAPRATVGGRGSTARRRTSAADPGRRSAPTPAATPGYAALNARLTLLGTLAGFVAAIPGVPILTLSHAPGVLVFDTFVFVAAAIAAAAAPP